jgi:flagellar biosynthesis/type III secretory pathway M-ring protein FliF/YscJ
VATKEEITTGSETEAASAAANNSAAPGTTKKDETIVTEYEVGKTVTQEVILPGEITSLSVAAVVDLSPADPNGAQASGQPTQIMDPNDVEKLIENALGLDLAGTDSLKVVDAKFQNPVAPLLDEETDGGLDFVAVARQASLGIMAICALLVLRMFRGARKKAGLGAASNQLSGAEGVTGLLPGGTSVPGPALLRQQITNVLEQDPERARQLFASWLEDKGG